MAKTGESAAAPRTVRKPQQDRGLRRVEEILDAAEAVIAEVGVEGASTNAIAERAGASMGSLYHFFASKDAIIEALARRFAERKRNLNANAIPLERADMSLEEIFDRVVESHARFLVETPAFVPVYDAVVQGRNAGFMTEELREAIVGQVRDFIGASMPKMPEKERTVSALLSVATIHGVMLLSMRMPPKARVPLHTELKRLMVVYFQPLVEKYGR
jgi:AcrR family transcriptional regulator